MPANRIKDLKDMTLGFQDGFSGTSAINEATPAVSDTSLGVDTHVLRDSRTLVPIGARFTTAGIPTIRTVTATQNSQQWTLTIDATGGTFDLVLNGETASSIAFDATSATVQTALEGLASITAGDVTVTGDGPHTITMAATFANTSTNTLTSVATSLTGGASTAVVAAVQDGTDTWEVTFTPAIATGSVPADDAVITWYPRRLEFEIDTGDLEWDEGANPEVRKSRGVIVGLKQGDEQEMTVSAAFEFSRMRAETSVAEGGANDKTPWEVLHQLGFAADWLPSSHGGVCEPYSVDIYVIDSPNCGSEQAEVMIFPQFAFTSISPSVQDGIVTFSGLCVAKYPIITSVTNDADAVGVIY